MQSVSVLAQFLSVQVVEMLVSSHHMFPTDVVFQLQCGTAGSQSMWHLWLTVACSAAAWPWLPARLPSCLRGTVSDGCLKKSFGLYLICPKYVPGVSRNSGSSCAFRPSPYLSPVPGKSRQKSSAKIDLTMSKRPTIDGPTPSTPMRTVVFAVFMRNNLEYPAG